MTMPDESNVGVLMIPGADWTRPSSTMPSSCVGHVVGSALKHRLDVWLNRSRSSPLMPRLTPHSPVAICASGSVTIDPTRDRSPSVGTGPST
jgi:hypothetical protein